MRRVHLYLGMGATAVLALVAFELRSVRPSQGQVVSPAAPARIEERDSSTVVELETTPAAHPSEWREQIPVHESVTEDPCASVTAELRAALASQAAAEKEVHELRDVVQRLNGDVARLRGELDRRPVPEDTPFGALLASAEAKDIKDPELLAAFRAILDDFPVMLRPGEAAWIAERTLKNERGHYVYPDERQLVYFLGPQRLAEEMPLDKLFKDLLWDQEIGLRLQACLPENKRVELNVKLQAMMKQSDDPEEIASLLARFPSFFN